nr:dynein heavy chain 10, axonemal-like [Halyomorpha halys]
MEPSTISETEWRFLHLVEVLVGYCKLLRENKPRQERIACLNTEIDIAQNFLNSSKVEIEQLEIEVKVNNEKNELEKADKYKAHCELEISVTILEAAEKLVYGLTSEHSSWKKKLNTLKQEKAHIIGNNLISASFLVYTGIFNYETRKELMQLWTNFLKTKEIPFSSNFKLETELVDTVLLRRWIAAGLSDNEFSIQNAILFTYSSRIPLCIDPKEEAVNWIMCMEDVNSFKVISYENINFHKQLEIAKKDNFSVLIKDADCIDPLVLQTIEAGRDKNGKKLWKLTKSLTDDHKEYDPHTIESKGKLLTGKATADVFIKHISKTDEIQIDVQTSNSVHKQLKHHFRHSKQTQNDLDTPSHHLSWTMSLAL